ncbi:hypothetical protein MtrunA17_Chr2g0307271 [Medicago truncatula]|uniref:Arabidopsis retrotransposon Orf1 C-terminal domain-containing protein n=1 Tax=Medicago truncatula TaxID=3880 RepID=A0A396J7W8_MEDTR|nr:hypothetical protein MtrunA17_Chr2g0307271 [Medicago truncatula]
MASKRSGKEFATSSRRPPPKKQVSAKNHGIIFKDNKQRDRYKNLISKPLHPCKYPDNYDLVTLGLSDNVFKFLRRLGWVAMLRPMRGYENFTYEFLSSIVFTKDMMNFDNPNHKISFRLMNIDYEMSLQHFCDEMSFANAGFIRDSWDQSLKPVDYQHANFWEHITDLRQFNTRSNKASNIHHPVLRYLQRVMTCTIWGRTELGNTRTDELFMSWAMLNNHPVNTCFYLLDYLSHVGNRFDSRGEIVVGGIITYIARQLGVGEDQGITKIEGINRLNIETLIFMNFIRPRPPMSYTLKLNVPILIILSNPSRTNTEVEENLLYVVDDPQVHEKTMMKARKMHIAPRRGRCTIAPC